MGIRVKTGMRIAAGYLILQLVYWWTTVLPPLAALGAALLFFLLAHGISRTSGLNGLQALGFSLRSGWLMQMLTGLGAGAACWGILAAIVIGASSSSIIGLAPAAHTLWLLSQACIGTLLGAAMSDLLTRGYILAHGRQRLTMAWPVALSVVLFTVNRTLMAAPHSACLAGLLASLLLGLTLALACIRTEALWLTLGLHWGMNVVFVLAYGMPGTTNGGLFLREPAAASSVQTLLDWAPAGCATLLLALVLWLTSSPSFRSFGSAAQIR